VADPQDGDDPDKGIPTKNETKSRPADSEFSKRSKDIEEQEKRKRDEDKS
jgi:hypothetical protein